MGRAPCCEKMGLKKGPWTPEEDQILISYIQRYGHENWRALPKHAGLLRCGKSCRLRWINYLRPDIKRGNFSYEEEETIIKLHELLGNRWSAIAARLPGRTDNEIKNVWHTHLKKRLVKKSNDNVVVQEAIKRHPNETTSFEKYDSNITESEPVSPPQSSSISISINDNEYNITESEPVSPPQNSSISISINDNEYNIDQHGSSTKAESPENFSEMDESFWMEIFPSNDINITNYSDCSSISGDPEIRFSLQESGDDTNYSKNDDVVVDLVHGFSSNLYDDNDMDFWYNIFTKGGDITQM